MEQHHRRFLENLTLRNLSPTTIKSYRQAVDRYFRYCRANALDQDVTSSIRAYLLHLKVDLDRSPSTVNIVYSAVKSYFTEGEVADWDLEALPRQRRPRRLPVVLSREEIVALFQVTRRFKYRAAFMVAYAGGLRRLEVRHLRVEDIDSKSMGIMVRKAKGSKQRYVMLSQRLLEVLRQYWRVERPQTWLFPADVRPSEPVSGDVLSRAFRLARDAAGLKRRASFHSLRHSFATHLLESRVPLPQIQVLLGHVHLSTTMSYLKVANVENAVQSPLDALGIASTQLSDIDI